MIGRIPIRLRLTLPFALAMAVVLAAMGLFLYARVGSALLSSIDQNLAAQMQEAASHAHEGRALLDRDVNEGPAIAQVERADDTTVDSTPSTLPPLLGRDTLASALRTRTHTTATVAGLRGDWRLLAVPVTLDDESAVLVVGRSLAAREETLHRLRREFLFAAPAVLLLAILAGYGLAAAALRPVEAMRRRAAAVSAATPGRRLPVPAAKDEISALAVTLNDMLARLEGAFAHERRFVADASHELRTPLALLRAELELALRRPRSRDELEAAIRSAAEETERLTRLAEDLLLIARADEGQLPIRPEQIASSELLDRVRGRFAARATMLGRTLQVDPTGATTLEVDPTRIEQALGNLVDNALHHGSGAVTLAARRDNGAVELHVTDEGGGFPHDFVERAFERFSRADEARSERGSGLGLAIVALIARAHGGEAHAANSPRGADVWLRL